MSHRNEDFLESLAQLRWPFGLAVGLPAFALLYWGVPFAATQVDDRYLALVAGSSLLKPIAWLLLVVGAIGTLLKRFRTTRRRTAVVAQTGRGTLQSLTSAQFVLLVAEAYRRLGYSVEKAGHGGAHADVDLLLRKDGALTLVQCQHWKAPQVGVWVARELETAMKHRGADAGKLICTGAISADCSRFAVGKPIELVDGPMLTRLVAGLNPLELS